MKRKVDIINENYGDYENMYTGILNEYKIKRVRFSCKETKEKEEKEEKEVKEIRIKYRKSNNKKCCVIM